MPLMQCQRMYLSQNLWTELNEFNQLQLLLTGICTSPTDMYVTHAHSIELKLESIFLFESEFSDYQDAIGSISGSSTEGCASYCT